MTAGVATTTPSVTLELTIGEEVAEPWLGDVNMDGLIDIRDAELVLSCYYGSEELTEQQLKLADVDGNGVTDARDANLIVSHSCEAIGSFPAES